MLDSNSIQGAFRAINHTFRSRILHFLDESVNGYTVTQILIHFRCEQAVASQHLAILRRAGLVKANRNGKFVTYTTNDEALYLLETIEKAWQTREGKVEPLIFAIEGVDIKMQKLEKAA